MEQQGTQWSCSSPASVTGQLQEGKHAVARRGWGATEPSTPRYCPLSAATPSVPSQYFSGQRTALASAVTGSRRMYSLCSYRQVQFRSYPSKLELMILKVLPTQTCCDSMTPHAGAGKVPSTTQTPQPVLTNEDKDLMV